MRVQCGDVRLFFDVEGPKLVPDGGLMRERPTLLLLHGGPGIDHSCYRDFFSGFADVAQVVYLDHRGNGRSDAGPRERWRLEQWGDDVAVFCEALEIQKPIVMGESFGGMVALAYAVRHPEGPGKLVLCSTAARIDLDETLAAFGRLGGPAARAAAERYLRTPNLETFPEYFQRCLPLYTRRPLDAEAMARTVMNPDVALTFFGDEFHRFDLVPLLPRIRCPTLVLHGEDDPMLPIGHAETIVAALPRDRVRFERFAQAGHPVYLDAPEALGTIREFLA